MKRLIVNADDFGRSRGVNDGILETHARGIVTSATVLVLESSAARGIRDAAERAPGLSLGLHFALTGGGRPAAPAREVPTVAPGGSFRRTLAELPERLPAEEVAAELEAQIAVFENLAGRGPTHLESHHHAALHPSVQPVFAAAAKRRGIPVRAASPDALAALRAEGLRTPDRFIDRFYAAGATFETLAGVLEDLAEGTTELMCHPARPDAELRAASTYVDERDRERELLGDPGIRDLIESRGIVLIGFDRL